MKTFRTNRITKFNKLIGLLLIGAASSFYAAQPTVDSHPYLSLALKSDGTVWQWGRLITETPWTYYTYSYDTPTQVTGFPAGGIVSIAAGNGLTWRECLMLAIDANGEVWRWGSANQNPTKVVGLSGVTKVSAGATVGLALKTDGTVWSISTGSIAQVAGLTGISAVSAGRAHFAALGTNGTLYSWGDNSYGQLGLNSLSTTVSTPTAVVLPGGGTVADIACGFNHTLVKRHDGIVLGTGAADLGQLASLSTTSIRAFQAFPLFSPAPTKICAKGNNSMFLSPQSYYACGDSTNGQLGPYSGTIVYRYLISPPPIENGIPISMAPFVALSNDGNVWTWGTFTAGAASLTSPFSLGKSITRKRALPIPTKQAVSALFVSNSHAQALGEALEGPGYVGSPVTYHPHHWWGSDKNFENFGFGWLTSPMWYWEIESTYRIDLGSNCTIFRDTYDHQMLFFYGQNSYKQFGLGNLPQAYGENVYLPEDIHDVVTSTYCSYAIAKSGNVYAAGTNYYGNLGDGSTITSPTWKLIPGLTNVKKIAAAEYCAIALKDNGDLLGWGYRGYGQLGGPTAGYSYSPVLIPGISNVIDIDCGLSHVMAIRNVPNESGRKELIGWGNNSSGQLGTGATSGVSTVPIVILPAGVTTDPRRLCTRGSSSYATFGDQLFAWGSNSSGQLGLNLTASSITSPTPVISGQNVNILPGGFSNGASFVASRADGSMISAGNNDSGTLGISKDAAFQMEPSRLMGFNLLQNPPVVSSVSTSSSTVAINSPVVFTPTVSDIGGTVASVRLLHEGMVVGTNSTAPFTINWTPTTWGTHKMFVVAVDNLGAYSHPFPAADVVVQYDSDTDTLPDFWEIKYFQNLAQLPTGDPDEDGVRNIDEYKSGLNPNRSDNVQSAWISVYLPN